MKLHEIDDQDVFYNVLIGAHDKPEFYVNILRKVIDYTDEQKIKEQIKNDLIEQGFKYDAHGKYYVYDNISVDIDTESFANRLNRPDIEIGIVVLDNFDFMFKLVAGTYDKKIIIEDKTRDKTEIQC